METDESLVARLRGGDLGAFDQLYERYELPLFGFIRSYLADSAEAEDLFHEVFMQVLACSDRDLVRFRGWLYTTARNLCLNRLRAHKRGYAVGRQIVYEAQEPKKSPEQILAEQTTLVALDRAVDKLPQRLSELFHLRASGMSYEEIATVLELPLGTVKSRMHEMVQQLRKDMAPWTVR
jgi:RNA polymerase sigma-70 factor (ECF subfamily)